jgi:hypothetical protein
MSKTDKVELIQLLEALPKQGYDIIGLIAYDPKLKLMVLAPLAGVPDKFVEQIGRRLGALPEQPWIPLVK